MSENRLLVENKLIILYLVKKMDVPLSESEIRQFILERRYMDYFTVQQYLAELVNASLLDVARENNATRYTITEDGDATLGYFVHQIPESVKARSTILCRKTAAGSGWNIPLPPPISPS